MSQQYAKDQPESFINKIERVAIAGGSVGKFLAKYLIATGKHTVTAITRKDSTNKVPEGAHVVTVDYDDEESLIEALKGQQFLAISMAVTAPPGTQEKIIYAAAKAGVPWIMPNCFGVNIFNKSLVEENLTGKGVLSGFEAIEAAGVSSWIAMCCSFWYEFSVAQGPAWYGFDLSNGKKKVTFYDDGNTQINTSTWDQCGRAFAALLSLKVIPDDENDKSATISQWRNKPLFMSSFLLSQRQMLDSLQRVTGTTDKDWEIEYEGSKERWERGMNLLKGGDYSGFALAMYARTFYPNGDGNFEAQHELANKALGLPEEDLDEATARAIELVEEKIQLNLVLSNSINLLHNLRRKLIKNLERGHCLFQLFRPTSTGDNTGNIGVLETPRNRKLSLADAQLVRNGLQLANLLDLLLPVVCADMAAHEIRKGVFAGAEARVLGWLAVDDVVVLSA
ncbi:hypothetical protein HG530_002598 [Fusarium avenaceum]|nr:hypothetical protein HG530_002598 [Fusarium avenaceum]